MSKKKEDRALIPLGDVQEYLPTEASQPIMTQAAAAVSAMGLPKEATVSLVQAITAKSALEARVKRQLSATDADKRKILGIRGFLAPEEVRKACELSKKEGVPLDSISMLQFGSSYTPYVQVKALMMKIDADPRLLKSIDVEDQKIEAGDDPYAFFRVKIKFWTGQEFEGIGAASKNGLLDKFRNRKFNMEDIINFARTRALGDAARKALMLSYDTLPEELIEEETKTTTTAYKVSETSSSKLVTRASVLSILKTKYGIDPSAVTAKLSETNGQPTTIQQATVAQIWEAAKAINPDIDGGVS